jgi:molybdopterin-containing oxidoreductase family iron-sulfur binding subunit
MGGKLPIVNHPSEEDGDLDRRSFLALVSRSAAAASLAACAERPSGVIVPYVEAPLEVSPGKASYYATSFVLGGYATGLLAESQVGRPIKIEGNPDHPASLGAAGIVEQASVHALYDPQRGRSPRAEKAPVSWRAFLEAFAPRANGANGRKFGSGLRFLAEPTSSPLVGELLRRIQARYPEAKIHFDAGPGGRAPWEATRALFGRPLAVQHDFRRAAVVVALDSDFLAGGPFSLRYARDFVAGRRVPEPAASMNRLYALEGAFTVTGGMADHRLRARPTEIALMAAALLAECLEEAPLAPDLVRALRARLGPWAERAPHRAALTVMARDLRRHRGRGIVIAGLDQPAQVHALAHALNAVLGNVGSTVYFTPPALEEAGNPNDLAALAADLRAGRVSTVVIFETNPVYGAPADLDFQRALGHAQQRIYFGLYENETSQACNWYLPATHYLESWGDARAYDGTLSFVQPLIAPLFQGRSLPEVLSMFLGDTERTGEEIHRDHWRKQRTARGFQDFWQGALRRGFIEGSAFPRTTVPPRWDALLTEIGKAPPSGPADTFELQYRLCPRLQDGRFSNNPWLQELPDPITHLTWDNAVLVSAATASRLHAANEDLIALEHEGRHLEAPLLIVPGMADGLGVLFLGYGRTAAEETAAGVGVNANRLRSSKAPLVATGVRAVKTGGHHRLATTGGHFTLEGRPIALSATLEEYRRSPHRFEEHRKSLPSVRPQRPLTGHQWGMVIDLAACTGCSACVVACQAENNTPVVGKAGVLKGREMQWLRIDRYLEGPLEAPAVITQPMLCQHCENAPCEYVCPVNATVHTPDGLNAMTYNRCVGTRFCSNNCPYKVRRFNWFNYHRNVGPLEQMVMNPDVTVRERGVMEKCTYCVQRIREGEIQAHLQRRELRDGEIQTACQQTCPTRAITFGSIADPAAAVSLLRRQGRLYSVLNDLNTVPRTQYLARIRNPNPELVKRGT